MGKNCCIIKKEKKVYCLPSHIINNRSQKSNAATVHIAG